MKTLKPKKDQLLDIGSFCVPILLVFKYRGVLNYSRKQKLKTTMQKISIL